MMKHKPTLQVVGLCAALLSACHFARAADHGSRLISRELWLASLTVSFPVRFCGEQMYFYRCFRLSRDECSARVISALDECRKGMQEEIPKTLSQPSDGQLWGSRLGACVGDLYEKKLRSENKKVATQECGDVTRWGR